MKQECLNEGAHVFVAVWVVASVSSCEVVVEAAATQETLLSLGNQA